MPLSSLSPLVLCLFLACSAERREARHVRADTSRLQEVAEAYWDAVRWEQVETAATAFESLDVRRRYIEAALQGGAFKVVDVSVVGVEVSAATGATPLRTGKVLVRLEAYDAATLKAGNQVLTQDWYRTPAGWFLDPAGQVPGM